MVHEDRMSDDRKKTRANRTPQTADIWLVMLRFPALYMADSTAAKNLYCSKFS